MKASFATALFTLIYFGVGIFIIYFFRKRHTGRFGGQGYKFPAIIYFVSIPIIVAIGTDFFRDYDPDAIYSFGIDLGLWGTVIIFGIVPTVIYIAIGLYILSREHTTGRPGYKLPALIYFISVPSLIVIAITLHFGMTYMTGAFENRLGPKPAGYSLYKFLVLKDIIPRSGQSLDEKGKKKVDKKEESTVENKVEPKKEGIAKVEKKIKFAKVKKVKIELSNYSYKLKFEKIINNLLGTYRKGNKVLSFKSKNSDNKIIDVNVFVKIDKEFLGHVIELKFISLDNFGKNNEVILEIYDKDPSTYSLNFKSSGKEKFTKLSFLDHKGNRIIFKSENYQNRNAIFSLYEEVDNDLYNQIQFVDEEYTDTGTIELDDYYKTNKENNKSIYDYVYNGSIFDYFNELEVIKMEKSILYFKFSDGSIEGTCNKNSQENQSYYLDTYTCEKISEKLNEFAYTDYEDKFYNTIFKDFIEALDKTTIAEKKNIDFIKTNNKLIDFLNNFYTDKKPNIEVASVIFDDSLQEKNVLTWGMGLIPDWDNYKKQIYSSFVGKGYLLRLRANAIESLDTILYLADGYSTIRNNKNNNEPAIKLYFKTKIDGLIERKTRTIATYESKNFSNEFNQLINKQNKYYTRTFKEVSKNLKEKTLIINFFNKDTLKEEFHIYDAASNEGTFNIINFRIDPSKHIFNPKNTDGELYDKAENKIKQALIGTYLPLVIKMAEEKTEFNQEVNLWYNLIDDKLLNKELIADVKTIEKLNEDYQPTTSEKYYALVIGNNNYEYLEKLDAAENDAKVITDVLTNKYGFEVDLLLNADYEKTVDTLFQITNKLKRNDNLLIYYAGHGELDKAENRGYWLPVDASYEQRSKWISNQRIVDRIKATKAKHVLLIADSCFSGTLMRSGITPEANEAIDEKYIERLKSKKTRLVITSGGNEPVVDSDGGDHSLFALKLIDTLKNNNTVINSQILFENIRRYVVSNADQTPERAMVHKTGHDGGDFLFFPKNYKNKGKLVWPEKKVGIGIQVKKNSKNEFEIVTVLRDSSASKAGLKVGDIIVRLNDKKLPNNLELIELAELIKGPIGSNVKISVRKKYLTKETAYTIKLVPEKPVVMMMKQ